MDEENQYYHQRAGKSSEKTGHHGARQGGGQLLTSNSKSSTDLRAGRSHEDEQKAWRELVMEEVRATVSSQNEKLKTDFGVFVQEIVGQIKLMASSRKEDREVVQGVQGDTEELIKIIRSLGGRFERLEQRFFNYEMEISTIREEGKQFLTESIVRR